MATRSATPAAPAPRPLRRDRAHGLLGLVCSGLARRLLDGLTLREREVLRLIAAHASCVLRKLQLSSRHELSRWAADRRLLGP